MGKIYETLKIETEIYKKFKQTKKLLEFQNKEDYSISQFLNFLVELQLNKLASLVKEFKK